VVTTELGKLYRKYSSFSIILVLVQIGEMTKSINNSFKSIKKCFA